MKKINLTFEVPREILLNANVSYHRFVKGDRAKKLRALASQTDVTETFNRFKVTVEVFPPTRRRLDPPNLYPTVKHLIDGLTDAKLWEDDDWKHMESMTFKYGGWSEIKNTFLIKFHIEEI